MKKYIVLSIAILLTSCDITKSATKSKKDIQATETIRTQIKRVGDTLRIEIPKVTYKDTTIVKTNYVNRTEARITYDNNGNASVDCISAEINQFREEFRTLLDKSKDKDSDKTESFNLQDLFWALAGFGVVVLLLMGFGFYILTKTQKATQNTLIDIAKGIVNQKS